MIATGLSASDREDPLQQERDYLFKRILLWEVVTFVILLFLGDKKSSKKVVGGHYRLCPPNPPATLLRSEVLYSKYIE